MSKFMYDGEKNPGDGSRHPLSKKLRRAIYNAKIELTQNKFGESRTVEKIRKL